MRNKYRVYVIGDLPPDLKNRISEIHASAILQAKVLIETVQRSERKKGKIAVKATG
jgi:hypothetical protein